MKKKKKRFSEVPTQLRR